MDHTWEAEIEFETGSNTVNSTTILYLAPGPRAAASAVVRFCQSRMKAVPEHFAKLYAIKVHMLSIQPIAADGKLETGRSLFGAEWKCDRGIPLEQWPSTVKDPTADAAEPDPIEQMRKRYVEGLEMLPGHMRDGVTRYIEKGSEVGGFLTALLCGQLDFAWRQADQVNTAHRRAWEIFLSDHVPIDAHNTPEKVAEWKAHNGLAGIKGKAL